MRRRFASSLIALLLLGACGGDDTLVDAARIGDITVTSAWARPNPGDGSPTAIYMTIDNLGAELDNLIGASAPACQAAELHESTEEDGVMRMRPLESIAVAPGSTLVLGPGGLHVMCLGVTQELVIGDVVPVTLDFGAAGAITVDADVRSEG